MSREYAHVILGVPVAVQTEIRDYLNDNSTGGELVREALRDLHPDKICNVVYSGTTYGIYLITVDDDTDAGLLRRIRDRWPTIYVIAAWKQNGVPLGQTWDENGVITGTPRYTLTPARYAALKAAWPVEFVTVGGLLIPINIMQGQIRWTY